jgi:hypothetical protein
VTAGDAAFADLPILAELGGDLDVAWQASQARDRGARRVRLPRRRVPSLILAAVVFLALAGGAAAATLLALRGSVIPGPPKQDLQPPMIVKPATAHLAGITARDPGGRRVWTVRVAQSQAGLVCTTAGELVAGSFGITGLDDRFRALAPDFVDGCGKSRSDRAAVIEARVFDAPRRSDVRTVVVGSAGSGLRHADLQLPGRSRRMPVSREGAFIGVVAGYPEDVGFRVRLTFADGRQSTQTFGRDQFVTPDRSGALRTEGFVISGHPEQCVRLVGARPIEPFTSGPVLCGHARGSRYFFDARLLRPGDKSARQGMFGWNWHRHPARTVVWGLAGSGVRRVTIVGPHVRRPLRVTIGRSFLALFPASVDPRSLELVFELANGRIERRRAPFNVGPAPRLR